MKKQKQKVIEEEILTDEIDAESEQEEMSDNDMEVEAIKQGRIIIDGHIWKPITKKETFYDALDQNDEIEVKNTSELGETLKEANSDRYDPKSKMSDIDFKSRLNHIALPRIVALDSLYAMRVYPSSVLQITRSYKRNMVSYNGLGRKETVDIASAGVTRNSESNQGFFGKFKGLFKKDDANGEMK